MSARDLYIPTADIIARDRHEVTVLCPRCGGHHTHKATPGKHWHASPCGLTLNPEDRLGYRFTVRDESRRRRTYTPAQAA